MKDINEFIEAFKEEAVLRIMELKTPVQGPHPEINASESYKNSILAGNLMEVLKVVDAISKR